MQNLADASLLSEESASHKVVAMSALVGSPSTKSGRTRREKVAVLLENRWDVVLNSLPFPN